MDYEERRLRRRRKRMIRRIIGRIAKMAMIVSVLVFSVHLVSNANMKPVSEPAPVLEDKKVIVINDEPAPMPVAMVVPKVPEVTEPKRIYLDCEMDHETQDLVYSAAEEFNIDFSLAMAVIRKETVFSNVKGDNGNSHGYMQIQPRWHYERMADLGVTDLMDPQGNFRVGCSLLSDLISKYGLEDALTKYNTGHTGHSKYADTVMAYYSEYKEVLLND